MSFVTALAGRLELSLTTISALTRVLINNGSFKDGAQQGSTEQLDTVDEGAIQSAILIIAEMSHRDFCELAPYLEPSA